MSKKVYLLVSILLGIVCNAHGAQKQAQITSVVNKLPFAWSFEFINQDNILITTINGQLFLIEKGKLNPLPIAGIPRVYRAGQGGLMDVLIDKDFEKNSTIYLSYSVGDRYANTLRLMKAQLKNHQLINQSVLFTAMPMRNTAHHYGARIIQLADRTLLLSVGDGFDYREKAQLLDNHFGKIIRIDTQGNIPKDNPFVNKKGALPEIFSYGHRNPQGLVWVNGEVLSHEHGPKGGDEVNRIEPGNNYGWPVITYGVDYNGAQITPYKTYPNMQQPLVDWTPSIAPSAMTFYDKSLFPTLKNSLLVVSLAQKTVRQIRLDKNTLVMDKVVFPELSARLRDIQVAPNGEVYILTDGENNTLYKVRPLP